MRLTQMLVAFAALGLAACAQGDDQQIAANGQHGADEQAPAAAPAPAAPGTLPGGRTPITEPRGPIDPKSAEAAGQVVQHYGALVEQRRFPEAEKLWRDPGLARAFSDELGRNDEVHMEIGEPGEMGGAAGSVYITVPVAFYGKDEEGTAFRRAADIILRRVNDVPGSSEAQRRWHIERIEWKSRPQG